MTGLELQAVATAKELEHLKNETVRVRSVLSALSITVAETDRFVQGCLAAIRKILETDTALPGAQLPEAMSSVEQDRKRS